MRKFSLLLSTIVIALSGCGGGGSGSPSPSPIPTPAPTPTPTAAPTPLPNVSLSAIDLQAFEKDRDIAKFVLERTGTSGALNVAFSQLASVAEGQKAASANDFELRYADGGVVGNTFDLGENQNSRVIEVHATEDNEHEVIETLSLQLASASAYELGSDIQAEVTIADASNAAANTKVFLGLFTPEGDAVTTATGSLSLLLSDDNMEGVVSYDFSGLTSKQTDQHIHLSPSGTVIKDVELSGPVSAYVWDMEPGGPFTTRQQMLDALFAGELYLNIHTANFPAGEITAFFNYEASVTPPEQSELTADDIDNDIIRFLTQATFGPTQTDYDALRAKLNEDGSNRLQVYNAWIDEQIALPQTSMLALTDASAEAFKRDQRWYDRRDAFWPIAVYGQDQLRQRVTFALSEILVIGDEVNTIRRAYRGVADYWDMLGENAFATYREALGDATRHAIMGFWLSHLRNQKADEDAGTYPDENYAREVMQLFSFGLVQRQKNGAIKLGNNNLPIATYDNNVIAQMARVFTGLAMSAKSEEGELVVNNNFFLNNATGNTYQYRRTEPMKFYPNYHEWGEKTLFTDDGNTLIIPENSDTNVAAADAELAQVLDALTAHSSTAPHVSRILIQRLVTSNPSNDYIERVANAFGQNGDMRAVIKAILLDPEARNPRAGESSHWGKVKELLLQFTALFRLLEGKSQVPLSHEGLGFPDEVVNQYPGEATILRVGDLAFGQRALGSPSVFNFFLPDFSPTGELAKNSLSAPELELTTETQLFTTMNLVNALLNNGFVRNNVESEVEFSKDQLRVKVSYRKLNAIWEATGGSDNDKAQAVLDFLDFYLNAGFGKRYETENRSILIDSIAGASDGERNKLTVYGVFNSPGFVVQK